MIHLRILNILAVGAVMAGLTQAATVSDLRCEYRRNPVGIDVERPRLSWVLDTGTQKAYQVEVAGVWESGKIVSDQSVNVEYGGPALKSGKAYEWKARVWDTSGNVSAWSKPASWG